MKLLTTFLLSLIILLSPFQEVLAHGELFSDLPETHRYHRSIDFLKDRGIIEGYDDNTVRPDNLINRAEFLKLLLEGFDIPLQAGSNCFTDIPPSEWYATYVCSAKAEGIVSGLPDGSFNPGRNINKAETFKVIVNTLDIPLRTQASAYTDVPKSEWFHDFSATLEHGNYLEEEGPTLNPGDQYTRGEISEILYRILLTQIQGKDRFDGSSTQEVQEDAQLDEWREIALKHINQLRSENGVAPITINPLLNAIAQAHSDDMAQHIQAMSHDGSLGDEADVRIRQGKVVNANGTGYNTLPVPDNIGWTGENVGRRNINGFGGSIEQAIIDQHLWFMDEPPDEPNHRTTMLSTLYPFSQVGIGLTLDEQGNLWITEDYISILNN